MVYNFSDKKSKGIGVANNEVKQDLQLAKELHKAIIRNFKKGTVYSEYFGCWFSWYAINKQ